MQKKNVILDQIDPTQKMESKQFTITKKIAKHGNQAIIVIPKILENMIKPGALTKIIIEVLN